MNILIAEDDANILEGLTDLLEAEGHYVTPCRDGEAAWQAYRRQRPDMLLLDIMMPRLDGYSLCKQIRKQDEITPLIFLSAKSEEVDKVLGLELGADDFIMKPFGTREVIARIRAVSRRQQRSESKSSATESFVIADLRIEPGEMCAWRGGQAIDLSAREIHVLQYLAQHQGQVVTRDALFDYAWGRDYSPNSRTLDQQISKLRKLVELDSKTPKIIQTVHGMGYRYPR